MFGFQVSQAIYAVTKLGIPTALSRGPHTIDQLASSTGTHPDTLARVVRLLAALEVFQLTGEGQVELTELGGMLVEGRPGSVKNLVEYWVETAYDATRELTHTLRTGELAAVRHYGMPFFDWLAGYPDLVRLQNRAMAEAVTMRQGTLDGYRLPKGAVVADIGGADGTILSQLLANDPERTGIVFDRPEVVEAARETLAAHGLSDRVQVAPGSFFEAVPTADVYVMSSILHDWDDASCLKILQTVAKAATPGARLVLLEMVVPPAPVPAVTAIIDVSMLSIVGGRERTAEEFRALLASGGFVMDRIVPTTYSHSIIEATLR